MSTDNSYNTAPTVKGESSSVVDISLNTHSSSEVKVIENRAENCEITGPVDNTVICKPVNERISSTITEDRVVQENTEERLDLSPTVDASERGTISETNGASSLTVDDKDLTEQIEHREGNSVELDANKDSNSSQIIQEEYTGNNRDKVEQSNEDNILNDSEVSKDDTISATSSANNERVAGEDNIDSSSENKSNKIEVSDAENRSEQIKTTDEDKSSDANLNEKSEPETCTDGNNQSQSNQEADEDTGEVRQDDLSINKTTDIPAESESSDDNDDKKSTHPNSEGFNVNGDGIKTDERPSENQSTNEHTTEGNVTTETSNINEKEADDSIKCTTKEGDTESHDSLTQINDSLSKEDQNIDTSQNQTENNIEETLTDENESEIQNELERVYERSVIDDDITNVRVSSAPESTHESDRGYSTELVIKTAIGTDDHEYEDDFEDIEEKDAADIDQTGNINQAQEEDKHSESNLTQLEQNIHTAKANWENGVKGDIIETDNSGKSEDINNEADDSSSDVVSTVIVIEGEGIPKVYLSTVPDRPPSSEPDLDDKRNPQDEVETTQDAGDVEASVGDPETEFKQDTLEEHDKTTSDKEVKIENSETEVQQEPLEEQPSKPRKGVDTEITMDDQDEGNNTNNRNEHITRDETPSGQNNDVDFNGQATQHKDSKVLDQSEDTERDDFYDDGPDDNKEKKSNDSKTTDKRGSVENHTSDNKPTNDNEKVDTTFTNAVSTDTAVSPTKEPEESEERLHLEQITKKEESPLEQLLKRNVEIDGSVESIGELEHAVTSLLGSMKTVMTHYQERLKLQALRDFTVDLGKFRGDFNSVNDAYQRCSSMSSAINQHLKDLRHVTDDIKLQISRKFQNEDLNTWIDSTPEQEKEKEKLQEITYAAEKAVMAKATEAKHVMATATIGVAEAQKFASEMEVHSIEAEVTATKAAAQARAAIITAEEARKASEERARAEEASKKRAEERARIKAEEDRRKKEEENMTIIEQAALKGSSVDDERKIFMEEKERREAERRNPKNWPRFTYNVKAEYFDPGVGCIIRAIEGSMRKIDVTCASVDQSTNVLNLLDQEELVSNIVTLKQSDEDTKLNFEEPFSIAIPVSNSRIPLGKESVIKQLTPDGKWKTLPTAEVQFEDLRELKFVEGRCRSFGTFVTVLSTRKDTMQFTPKSFKAVSSVDSRITFSNKPGSFKHTVNATVEVKVIDVNAVSDLKVKVPNECEDLLTASPFVTLGVSIKKFEKPIVVTMPLPQNLARQKRPTTGAPRESRQQEIRPATARPASIKDDEELDAIHFLYLDDKNGWTKDAKCKLHQPKNKDVVSFEMAQPRSRFVLLRTRPETKDVRVEKLATLLEKSISQRNVKLFLRQHHDDAFDIKVGCTVANRIQRALKTLEEDEGYTEGPNPSGDLILQEGQQLYLRFRGNIKCVSEQPDLTMIYNTHIKACRQLFVEEIDKFAQKGLQNYRGFLQVLTKALVPRALNPGAPPTKGPAEMVEAEVLLCELLIELPKPEAEPPKPLKTAPLPIQDGPLTGGVLRYLAGYLGKEWKDLALHLNLKPMRIQAILRQNVNKDTPQTKFDMLMAWAKRIPKSVDKVQILCSALQSVGRPDLVEEVRYRGDEFRQKRQMNARASHLRQAFVKVAKTSAVFTHWQKFARGLGVPDDAIKKIEGSGGSGQEKCYNILETWKDHKGEDANVSELASHLRTSKHEYLSREVESIMAV